MKRLAYNDGLQQLLTRNRNRFVEETDMHYKGPF